MVARAKVLRNSCRHGLGIDHEGVTVGGIVGLQVIRDVANVEGHVKAAGGNVGVEAGQSLRGRGRGGVRV